MNSSGRADDNLTPDSMQMDEDGAQPSRPRPSLLLVLLLLVGVAFAAYIGSNVLGVLFGIVSPPLPPLPDGLTEVSHSNEAYGADVWTYSTSADACEIADTFRQWGVCTIAPLQCGTMRDVPSPSVDTSIVARCSGGQEFSIFNMKWWALVSRKNSTGTTQVEVEREVFWIGTGPS